MARDLAYQTLLDLGVEEAGLQRRSSTIALVWKLGREIRQLAGAKVPCSAGEAVVNRRLMAESVTAEILRTRELSRCASRTSR